jgi:hypothetical protein
MRSASSGFMQSNGLRFTCAAERSGAASGGSACWAATPYQLLLLALMPKRLLLKADSQHCQVRSTQGFGKSLKIWLATYGTNAKSDAESLYNQVRQSLSHQFFHSTLLHKT